ncbi:MULTISPECIES: hypothetical protein [unclassified Dysgonomonas]|uniref:hypothetical protein n=1 Tax=unclassified Dysgonomonas TaxID=2630389 RepID=UPI0025C337F2|nr:MULTISPECIES: hypothetical protein [unclassified Dysgonomonas]HMM02774.1 hypothetical protein [Dysgonomonas sp.]
MKAKIYGILLICLLVGYGCDAIEDELLRDDFNNPGTPISQADLDAAISVTQPIPNTDDKVEGDQYVVIKNNRPDIGGVWHLGWSTGEKIVGSDNDTIIYDTNGEYDIYYTGISANEIVTSKKFHVSITNCFDEYDFLLSGAVDKADKTAKKTWKFMEVTGALYNGMYGNWKYYAPVPNQNSWGTVNTATVPEQTMTFEFDGHKMTTYLASGAVSKEGIWAYTHNTPEGVTGELITTAPVIGTSFSWNVWSGVNTPYWITSISEDLLVLCFPSTYNKPAEVADWDIDAMYFFLVPVE